MWKRAGGQATWEMRPIDFVEEAVQGGRASAVLFGFLGVLEGDTLSIISKHGQTIRQVEVRVVEDIIIREKADKEGVVTLDITVDGKTLSYDDKVSLSNRLGFELTEPTRVWTDGEKEFSWHVFTGHIVGW